MGMLQPPECALQGAIHCNQASVSNDKKSRLYANGPRKSLLTWYICVGVGEMRW